jgi:hypothetical protein
MGSETSPFTYLGLGILVVVVGLLLDLDALSILMALVAALTLVALVSTLRLASRWLRDFRRAAAPLVRSGGFAQFRTRRPRRGARSPLVSFLRSGGFSLLRGTPAHDDGDKWTRA